MTEQKYEEKWAFWGTIVGLFVAGIAYFKLMWPIIDMITKEIMKIKYKDKNKNG